MSHLDSSPAEYSNDNYNILHNRIITVKKQTPFFKNSKVAY